MKGTKENIETNGDIQTYKEKNTKETRETVETNVDTHQYKSARRDTRETMETNAGILVHQVQHQDSNYRCSVSIPPRGPGFSSTSPDNSSRDKITEAATDNATSSIALATANTHVPSRLVMITTSTVV